MELICIGSKIFVREDIVIRLPFEYLNDGRKLTSINHVKQGGS